MGLPNFFYFVSVPAMRENMVNRSSSSFDVISIIVNLSIYLYVSFVYAFVYYNRECNLDIKLEFPLAHSVVNISLVQLKPKRRCDRCRPTFDNRYQSAVPSYDPIQCFHSCTIYKPLCVHCS